MSLILTPQKFFAFQRLSWSRNWRGNALDSTQKILEEKPDLKKHWTSLIPQGKMGKPEDLMGAVAFLLSDASGYITGVDLRVDGGYTITWRFDDAEILIFSYSTMRQVVIVLDASLFSFAMALIFIDWWVYVKVLANSSSWSQWKLAT